MKRELYKTIQGEDVVFAVATDTGWHRRDGTQEYIDFLNQFYPCFALPEEPDRYKRVADQLATVSGFKTREVGDDYEPADLPEGAKT